MPDSTAADESPLLGELKSEMPRWLPGSGSGLFLEGDPSIL
jgi:hypothetical protein